MGRTIKNLSLREYASVGQNKGFCNSSNNETRILVYSLRGRGHKSKLCLIGASPSGGGGGGGHCLCNSAGNLNRSRSVFLSLSMPCKNASFCLLLISLSIDSCILAFV